MRNFIVFDLEATCDDKQEMVNEIIEIGAVKINEQGQVIDSFQRFVKPILFPVLTDFCKNLTNIKQEDVDLAQGFKSVIQDFQKWIGEDYILCSWGFYDKKQLKQDCLLHHVPFEWVEKHISLKHQYQTLKNLKRAVGTRKALSLEGLDFEGTQHRGIDDAQNIAKIFIKYMNQWDFRS